MGVILARLWLVGAFEMLARRVAKVKAALRARSPKRCAHAGTRSMAG
jgi:hypothetical protein